MMTTPTPDALCKRLRTKQGDIYARLRAHQAADFIQQQQATIERLSAALAFYANEHNWRSVTVYMCGHGAINCNVMADKGSKARAALKASGEE
jgi:hypothetical protein